MRTLRFSENQVVEREGYFLPFFSADVAIGTGILVAAAHSAHGVESEYKNWQKRRKEEKEKEKNKKFGSVTINFSKISKLKELFFCNKEKDIFETSIYDLELSL